jgi:hypothetical protein
LLRQSACESLRVAGLVTAAQRNIRVAQMSRNRRGTSAESAMAEPHDVRAMNAQELRGIERQ